MKKILFILLIIISIKVNASVVVMDGFSGRVLYSKNQDERKLIASTTKIMTSIIALENGNLEDEYIVGKEIKEVNGSMIYVKEGEKLTLNDLLHGLMLQSGNDAAMVIANNVMKYDEFIANMNIKAYKLGMYNTSFENPHGLNDNTKNYSTAYDMALLMKYAIKNSSFLKITSTKKYKVKNYIWYNKNKLLSDYKYLISGKIGYTKSSGQVFVSSAIKDNKLLIIASIDEKDKFNLHKSLYEKYFSLYNKYKIIDKNTLPFIIRENSNDYLYINNDYYMMLKDNEIKDLNIKYNISDTSKYISIYLKDNLIHKEKINSLSYLNRTNKVKQSLLFWK